MIGHLRTIAWLQLRLVKNSATRDLRWLGAFAWVIQMLLAAIGCLVLTVGGAIAGVLAFQGDNAWILMVVLDSSIIVLALVRLIMLLVELNERDFIDSKKFLFLPIRLGVLFAINFIVRNFTGLLLIALPPLISLCVAISFVHGPQMLLGIPLGIAMIFAIACSFDYLREWVLTFGESKAKTFMNVAIVLLSLLIAAGAMGGGLAAIRAESQSTRGVSEEKLEALKDTVEMPETSIDVSDLAHDGLVYLNTWIPFGWFPLGMYHLTDGKYAVALFGAMGLMVIAVGLLALDYRLVLRQFRDPVSADDTSAKHRKTAASRLTRLSLMGLDSPRAAFVGLTCLSRARSFAIRSATWMYIGAAIVAVAASFLLDISFLQNRIFSDFAPFAVTGALLFFSMALFSNIFAQDRSGFQVLVLMPVDRRTYLLTKNAVLAAVVMAWIVLGCLVSAILFRPHPIALAATLVMAIQAQITFSIVGNGLSILFPFRLKEGALEQPAQPMAAMLPGFLLVISLPIAIGPLIFTGAFGPLAGWVWKIEGAWVSLGVALLFLVATAIFYAASIPGMAALLQRRETRMLEILASDRE